LLQVGRTAHLELAGSHVTKYAFFPQNSRWQTAAMLKTVFDNNSAGDCPISVKCCVREAVFHKVLAIGHIPAFHRT